MNDITNEDAILEKSIDTMIDNLFTEPVVETPAEGEGVEKSIDISGDAKTTADAVVNKAPKSQDDASRGAGRPAQISDVPKTDLDGKRTGEYDSSIASNKDKESQPEEAAKQADSNRSDQTMKDSKGSEVPSMKKSISDEEYAEYLVLKKAKEDKEEEEKLQKAQNEQKDLIKAAVMEATQEIRNENANLKTKLEENNVLVKSIANAPERQKSISNISALEKSNADNPQPEQEFFNIQDKLDVAEELVLNKSMPGFKVEHLAELESSGFIYEQAPREMLEKALQKKA